MNARVFLLADSGPPERGETVVVSTALGGNYPSLQSMLAVESMTELYVWRLTTMAPYASIKLPSTLGNLCLFDEHGAIGAVDQAGSFQLVIIEEDLGSLSSMIARRSF